MAPPRLAYCANVHPGESLAAVGDAIAAAAKVRALLEAPRLGLGLWLSRAALTELGERGTGELAGRLEAAGLEVFTLNGFPYGDFHADVVKRAVYHPDWTTAARLAYTLELADVAIALAPPGVSPTISTLPLGHRGEGGREVVARAADALCRLAASLAERCARTGTLVRVGLEPEPGCWLETSADAIRFFTDALWPAARRSNLEDAVRAHIGLCFDTCHHAVAFDDPASAVRALAAAGVPIVKVQLSSALELSDPRDAAARAELAAFAEPRFLHQVRARRPDGTVEAADDLPDAAALPTDGPWRCHFHVPIHRDAVGRVATTRAFLEAALPALCALDPAPHFEVETYTWTVLPEGERPRDAAGLVAGLTAELSWARARLEEQLP